MLGFNQNILIRGGIHMEVMDIIKEFSIQLKEHSSWNMHKLHFHDYLEFMLVLSDDGEFFLQKNICEIKQNTLFIINSSTLHRTVNTSNLQHFKRYVLHISPMLLSQISTPRTNFASMISDPFYCIPLTPAQSEHIINLSEQLISLPKDNFGADVRCKIVLLEFILEAMSAAANRPPVVEMTNGDYNRILPVLQYIEDHFTEQISLEDLSKYFSINKYHLCHMFKSVTSFSIFEYIIQKRILKARELLRSPISVQEAGELAGFQTNSYFIRTFHKYTGISPRKYAQQYIQSENSTLVDMKKARN